MTWCTDKPDGIIINIRITPRASKNEICGLHDDALKIRLQAPPVDGKANKALIKFLAKAFNVKQADIKIVSGESSRSKRIQISGLTAAEVQGKIG